MSEKNVGFKAFNRDFTNKFGQKFEVGSSYVSEFKDYLFHYCINLEDVFVYYRNTDEIIICEVEGSEKNITYDNDYYAVYDVCASEKLYVKRILSRKEIILYGLNLRYDRLKRFVSLYKMNTDEIVLFKERFVNNKEVIKYIEYYQENNTNVFNLKI